VWPQALFHWRRGPSVGSLESAVINRPTDDCGLVSDD
jgi:hypothetical protein